VSVANCKARPKTVHWIGSQPRGIVGILVPAGDRHHPLRQRFAQLVPHLARLPQVFQTIRQRSGQSRSPIGGFEQNRSTVGTALHLVKLGYDRLGEYIGKQQTLCCGIVTQAKASFGASNIVFTTCLYHRRLSVSLRT
jgi:hypothetical protein